MSSAEGNPDRGTEDSGQPPHRGLADREVDPRAGGLTWRHAVLAALAVGAVLALIFFWPAKKPTPIRPSQVTVRPAPKPAPPAPPRVDPGGKQTVIARNDKPAVSPPSLPTPPKPTAFPRRVPSAVTLPPPPAKAPQVTAALTIPPPPAQTPAALPSKNDDFAIEVLSRTNRIEDGSSFPFDDRILGELALGDIKVMTVFTGQRVPKGRLTLEWVLDGVPLGRKPVRLGQLVEYGAEPTVGTYKVLLRLEEKIIQSFTFRITPAK